MGILCLAWISVSSAVVSHHSLQRCDPGQKMSKGYMGSVFFFFLELCEFLIILT